MYGTGYRPGVPQDSFGLAAAGIVACAGIVANPPRPFFTARHPDVLYCHY